MEENKICLMIRKYIYKIFSEDDDVFFTKRTTNSLGRYLFAKIRKNVKGATSALIKKEILRYSRKPIVENYYNELTNQVGIKMLPLTALSLVKRNYLKVKRNYQNYFLKANNKLDSITDKLNTINLSDMKIKGSMGKTPLSKDLSNEFLQLYINFEQRERLRTYREIIEFDKQYLSECWKEEFEEEANVNQILRKKAKSICMGYDSNQFAVLKQHIQAAESNLKDELIVFYKAKLIPLYEKIIYENMSKHIAEEMQGKEYDVKEELKAIPEIADLIDKKNNNSNIYIATLEKLFNDFSIIDELNNAINNIPNDNRKEILRECLVLFESKKYGMFINILPIQIEGLFYDLLVDSTTYQLFTHIEIYEKPTLREKLDSFHENMHIDIFEYFKFYFNNLIRNVVAHGRVNSNNGNRNEDVNMKIIAYELILDLNCLLYYYIQKSEFIRMNILLRGFYKNIKGNDKLDYEKMNFNAMFATISRQRHISIFNFGIERFEPMQTIYWIFNPFYEKRYCSLYDKQDLDVARGILNNPRFWEYVNIKLLQCVSVGYDYERIDKAFGRILNVILGITEKGPLKNSIIKVNRTWGTLKKVDSDFIKEMNSIE